MKTTGREGALPLKGGGLLPFVACLVLVVAAGAASVSDAVYLTDGSRLVGTIERLNEGRLVIETDFAGTVTVDAAKVEGIDTDRRLAVTLSTGDRVVGVLRFAPEEGQRIAETAFGEVAVDEAEIAGLRAPDEPAPAERAAQEQAAEVKEQHEREVERIREEHQQRVAELEERTTSVDSTWSGRIELGLDGKTGNTERINFRGRAEALRETRFDRLLVFIQGNYAEDAGEASQNEIFGGTTLEIDLTDRLFTYGRLRLERDRFEDLDLRANVTGGLGYFFIQEERMELKGRAGAGFQSENFSTGENQQDLILEFGYDFRYDIDDWLRFTSALTYFPALGDPLSEYLVDFENAGEIPLSDDEAWKLRLGARHEYDADPQPGIDKLDTSYFLNLVYETQ